MEGRHEWQFSYDWNQSHDQATVLLNVPYETLEEDVVVVIDGCYLLAGVRGQPPLIKGRLYGNIHPSSSWQLEPRSRRISTRERTTSTTSTTSTRSSYAFVSDPEISSSFAASLESEHASDAEEPAAPSPALSSTLSSPAPVDERGLPPLARTHNHNNHNHNHNHNHNPAVSTSRSGSPGLALRSMASSLSSLESLHSLHSGRLLTIHLEKDQSVIWPSLIVGPVPETLSPSMSDTLIYDASHELEHKYNMDPTSLVMVALELSDIRKDKEEAFECLVRAWLQSHIPTATMRLTRDYLPTQTPLEHLQSADDQACMRGSPAYYFQCIGRSEGLAQLYLEAGLLHLEGAASALLHSSHSSIRSRQRLLQPSGSDADAWRRDREAASRYFDRAKALRPDLDVPSLPSESDGGGGGGSHELEMPTLDLNPSAPESVYSGEESHADGGAGGGADPPTMRRRRKKEELVLYHNQEAKVADMDSAWYLYVPGLVGAGTALLVVGVIGALSFSTWRRNQSS